MAGEKLESCSIIMFNCIKKKGQITSWAKDENIADEKETSFILQNHLDSFDLKKSFEKLEEK